MNAKNKRSHFSPEVAMSRNNTIRGDAPDAELIPLEDSQAERQRRFESIPLRFLRFHAVRDRTGLSRSTIWRLERRGLFPKHRRISANAVGWLEGEVNDWVLTKMAR